MYNVTIRSVRVTIVAVKKQCVAYSECACVALGIHHVMHMRHVVIDGLPGSTIYFTHYFINGTILDKKVTEYKLCVLIFPTFV